MKKKIAILSFYIGIIFLIIGFYYCCIKAGIPYQEPTIEMLEKYNRNLKIGESLILIGVCIELVNLFGMIVNSILIKSKRKV